MMTKRAILILGDGTIEGLPQKERTRRSIRN